MQINEEETINHELEDEINRYFNGKSPEELLNTPYNEIARHFAKWQEEQDQKSWNELLKDLLESAHKVTVKRSPLNGPIGISLYCSNCYNDPDFKHAKEGDKFKVIILKDND